MAFKVLVVDDSKLARMAVAKVLGGLRPDWTRVEATNADEAFAALQEQTPDLVVLGLQHAWTRRTGCRGRASPDAPGDAGRGDFRKSPAGDRRPRTRDWSHLPFQTPHRTGAERFSDRRREEDRGWRSMNEASPSTLNELELDALTELVNLGVSKAALSLREMIGAQVFLSVPSVEPDRARARDRNLGEKRTQHARRGAPGVRGRHSWPRAADLPGNAQSRAGSRRHQWKPPARGHTRTRTGSAGRDRQHHPERLPRDYGQPAATHPENIPARRSFAATAPPFSACRRRPRPAISYCSFTSISWFASAISKDILRC